MTSAIDLAYIIQSKAPADTSRGFFWFIVDSRERYSKEAGLKFIDIVSTQTSTTSEPKLRAFVPPCETLLLLALCSMTRHKDQHDAISHTETRRHGGSSTAQNPSFVPPCETLLLLALRSMARHTGQHDAISHTETRRLIHRTEQNLRLLEALGSSAPKGIITSTLAMGFGCAMELNQWFYAPTPR